MAQITEIIKLNLLDHALHFQRFPADLREVRVLRGCHNLLWVARHNDLNVCQRPTSPGIVEVEDILLGSSNSGCMISLMAHFRLHPRYKELQKTNKLTHSQAGKASRFFIVMHIISLGVHLTSRLRRNYACRRVFTYGASGILQHSENQIKT